MRRVWIAAAIAVTGVVPALAASGQVVDALAQPMAGAEVCLMNGNREQRCVATDAQGRYVLPESELQHVRIVAPDHLARTVAAIDHPAPIVMQRAPTLLVRLVDQATSQPISQGRIFVTYPSGRRLGPFPSKTAGVRVRRLLEPGSAIVQGEADGYARSTLTTVELEAGKEVEVVLELKRAS